MGHKGDIENRYTTNKQRLPESVVEDMRAAYARSEEFLQTKVKEETSEEKLRGSFRKQLLLVAGFTQAELDKTGLPIPIATVNLPAPRCYSPVPIWTEPTASESGPLPVEPPK